VFRAVLAGLSIEGASTSPRFADAVRLNATVPIDSSAWERSESGRLGPSAQDAWRWAGGGSSVIILGLVLLVIGFVADIGILVTIGIILLIIGAVLWILGSRGRPVGGRRHYW